MRIILTHVGKEEISKDFKSYNTQNEQPNNTLVSNTEVKTHNDINSGKIVLFPLKPRSINKYNNNKLLDNKKYNQMNSNSLLKAGLYSINNNYKRNYNNPFSNYTKKNNKKNDLPLKLISLNNSLLSLPIETKQLYDNEEMKDKDQLTKLNISNYNIKDDNDINNTLDNSRNISLPKKNMSNVFSLKNLLSPKNKRHIDD